MQLTFANGAQAWLYGITFQKFINKLLEAFDSLTAIKDMGFAHTSMDILLHFSPAPVLSPKGLTNLRGIGNICKGGRLLASAAFILFISTNAVQYVEPNILLNVVIELCPVMCRRPSAKESKRGGPSSDEVMTGLNHNLITQRFKLNNKVALITGAATASGPLALFVPFNSSWHVLLADL